MLGHTNLQQQQHQQPNHPERVKEKQRVVQRNENAQKNLTESLRAIREEQDRKKEGEIGLEDLARNVKDLTRTLEEGMREKEEREKREKEEKRYNTKEKPEEVEECIACKEVQGRIHQREVQECFCTICKRQGHSNREHITAYMSDIRKEINSLNKMIKQKVAYRYISREFARIKKE